MHGIPHVATVHSLEPLRPWKAEQLGGGYALSASASGPALEAADAVIAVSQGSRRDILAAIRRSTGSGCTSSTTGSTPRSTAPDPAPIVAQRLGIDPRARSSLFVGRITRQKGVPQLLRAAADFEPGTQLILVAGSPDTPEIGAEVAAGVERLQA